MHSCLEVQLQFGERGVAQLREEITLLERRIRLMGEDGDCAYERAMSTLYRKIRRLGIETPERDGRGRRVLRGAPARRLPSLRQDPPQPVAARVAFPV